MGLFIGGGLALYRFAPAVSPLATPKHDDQSIAISNSPAGQKTSYPEAIGEPPKPSTSAADLGDHPAQTESVQLVHASVTLDENKATPLTPNEIGLYPRVLVSKEQTIPISIIYANSEPGEVLIISAEDGGNINNSTPVNTTKLDAQGAAHFLFTTSQDEGIFRVTVRRGAEQTQFNFWVGPEPRVQTNPSSI